ncbi:MAG: OadG family protein [Clostridia bacterium]|nr:OadG family protein [Clostridia bacterium]
MSPAFVCIVGIATVFSGLIAIIILCKLMSAICSLFPEKKAEPAISPAQQPRKSTPGANGEAIANKEEIVAGVCAVIAEELGTDVSNIRVVSFKKA